MGSFFSTLNSWIFPNNKGHVMMIGLDGAGKTTILYKIKNNEVIDAIPTIGFNIETVTFQNNTFNIWDITGQKNSRSSSRHYLPNTTVVVFVIDSSDVERIPESKEILSGLLGEPYLEAIPVLILANKQDLPNAKTPDDLTQMLDLQSIKNREWFICGTDAYTGQGIVDSLIWIKKQLKASFV